MKFNTYLLLSLCLHSSKAANCVDGGEEDCAIGEESCSQYYNSTTFLIANDAEDNLCRPNDLCDEIDDEA